MMLDFTTEELIITLRSIYAKWEETYDSKYLPIINKLRETITLREAQEKSMEAEL